MSAVETQRLLTAIAILVLITLPIIFGIVMAKHREAIGE